MLSLTSATSGTKSQPTSSQGIRHSNGPVQVQPQNSHCGSNSRKRPAEGAQPEPKRQHVIGLSVVDNLLYVWRYNRWGAIQCFALNFIEDLPHFLRLLLVMQRFQNHHCGLNPSPPMICQDRQGKEIGVTLELSSNEDRTHLVLNGCATNIFSEMGTTVPGASNEDDLPAKVLAENSRVSKPDIPEKVYEIAKREEAVKGHVPDMECYKMYTGVATGLVQKRLGIDAGGSRVLGITVSPRLKPITELYEDTFLHARWETVRCNRVLWESGARHRDISSSNLMYRKVDGKIFGVLNDFDLESTRDDPTGTERTGTVPFMALALLEESEFTGKIQHGYEHDAESFIWVLIFIILRYENGKLRETGRPLDRWLRVDAATCLEKTDSFLIGQQRKRLAPAVGHEQNCKLAHQCLDALAVKKAVATATCLKKPPSDVDIAFQQLPADNIKQLLASPATK